MPVAEDVRVDSLVAHTEGYSGAEVSNHGSTHNMNCVLHYFSFIVLLFYWV